MTATFEWNISTDVSRSWWRLVWIFMVSWSWSIPIILMTPSKVKIFPQQTTKPWHSILKNPEDCRYQGPQKMDESLYVIFLTYHKMYFMLLKGPSSAPSLNFLLNIWTLMLPKEATPFDFLSYSRICSFTFPPAHNILSRWSRLTEL